MKNELVEFRTIDPEEDLVFLFEGRNHDEVRRWCRQVGLLHWEGHLGWISRQADDPTVEMFMVYSHKGERVGCCGLTSIDLVNRRAEFSLWIDPEQRRLGYAEAALRLLFQYGFGELNLNRIWGETFEDNPARRLFTRMGMIEEGRRIEFYYKRGRYIDAYLYSVGRDQFSGYLASLADSQG